MEYLQIGAVLMFYGLVGCMVLLTLLIVGRQFIFTTVAAGVLPARSNLPLRQASAGEEPADKDLPSVAIIVPAHNEERVIAGSLEAMLQTDYPKDRLQIIVVNDRSTDGTRAIIDAYAERHPIIRPVHRPFDAVPGKSAALSGVTAACKAEILVFFDADYLPEPRLVRKLVAPFEKPEIGATMGRVVPINSNANLLTRLIDLERRGGYVIDQQMRDHWRLLPQFGGTTGAVRAKALKRIGGWRQGHLTEDTYLTYAMFLQGYEVAYLNDAACYEETPQTWQARYKQVRRWAYGHNDCLLSFLPKIWATSGRSIAGRIDASIVLLFYIYPVFACLALPASILGAALLNASLGWMYAAVLPLFFGFGNLAPFFQIAVAVRKDEQEEVLRYLPLIFVSSMITMFAATDGFFRLLHDKARRRRGVWDKTVRFRTTTPGRVLQIGQQNS